VSKQYWRLLEPGDVWQEGDEISNPVVKWEQVPPSWIKWEVKDGPIGRRRITLSEPQGWISVKDRMPTKEDANKQGMVVWWDGLNRNDGDWDDYEERFTHWSTVIDALEPDRDPDEEAWDFFKGSILHAQPELEKGISWEFEKKVFLAGRKSVETEGGSK
jgi:hypothetical protein